MADPFQTFIYEELPQRAALLTFENTGYSGDPNIAVLSKINTAPKGTWYLNQADFTLWYKKIKTDPTSWEQLLGRDSAIDRIRRNIPLIGVKNGVNKIFTSPDKFVRTPYVETVKYNGITLEEGVGGDYTVSESVPGDGYDTITMEVALLDWEKLTIDYIKKDY